MGFSQTTPIQEKAIPVIMSGRDLIASAQTGTEKTAAFLLPVMNDISEKRQTLMFSATMPPKIRAMSKHIMNNPVEISLEMSKPADGVIQSVYHLDENQKLPLIKTLLTDNPDHQSILIFSSTKHKVNEIVRGLRSGNYLVEGISSDLGQKEREEMLIRFSSRQSLVLVATNVLSRGTDIKNVNMVINYDAPSDSEDYVHRVGRTAHAEKTGVAVTLINKSDLTKMQRIEKLIGYKINIVRLPDSVAAKHGKIGEPGFQYRILQGTNLKKERSRNT